MKKIKGKYGHSDYIKRLPYIAVRKSGSINCCLFRQLIKEVTFDLYPKETVLLEIAIDRFGRLIKGPFMRTMDTGQGRMANLDDEGWDEWAEEIREKGVIINGLLGDGACQDTLGCWAQLDGSGSNFIRRSDQGWICKSQLSYCGGIHEGKGNSSPPQAGL